MSSLKKQFNVFYKKSKDALNNSKKSLESAQKYNKLRNKSLEDADKFMDLGNKFAKKAENILKIAEKRAKNDKNY